MATASHDPVQHSYDQLADEYDSRWAFYIRSTLDVAIQGLALCGDERILDVACGTGELERHLRPQWPLISLNGVDVSAAMLERARSKGRDYAAFLQAEAAHLPFADDSFDVVLSANAFHYFRSPDASLREMRRVLAADGRLVIVDWCDDYLSCKLCSLWLRWSDPAFFRTYSLRECQRRLERAGLRILEKRRQRVGWIWGLMRLVAAPDSRPQVRG